MEKSRNLQKKKGALEETLKIKFKELDAPEVSPQGQHILSVFLELSSARQGGFSGPLPISFQEIQAYLNLFEVTLEQWELHCLRMLDIAFLDEVAKISEEQ